MAREDKITVTLTRDQIDRVRDALEAYALELDCKAALFRGHRDPVCEGKCFRLECAVSDARDAQRACEAGLAAFDGGGQ